MLASNNVQNVELDFIVEKFKPIIEELVYKNICYKRIKKNFRGFNYGEIIIDEHIVPLYPPIYRCYNFKKALRNQFQESEKFLVEEKMDGYNVRIINYAEEILCFTRGGFVWPYTTEKLENYPEIFKI